MKARPPTSSRRPAGIPRVLEGQWWDQNKVVLMEFADAAAFRAWATSPEYTEIAEDRKAGAEAVVLLIKGFSGA